MVRIVGIQRSDDPRQEFVLLQNQGSMRVALRGYAVIADVALTGGATSPAAHFFSDDVGVMPGQYVLLRTAPARPGWSMTTEGQRVYTASMERLSPVWSHLSGPVHVLAPQHTYCERTGELVVA